MPQFRVTFRKIVYGNTGHASDICQRIVAVDACDSGSAEAAAIDCFCEKEHIANWLDHADRLEIVEVERVPAGPAIDDGDARRAA